MSGSDRSVVRKFNPGMLQGDDEVIRQFVVRNSELQALLGVLRENVTSPSCQHALVIGPRGRGKTMLLARVAAEIRAADDLSRTFVPVRLMEESYEVSSLGDFWLEVLFQLAMEVESQNPDLSVELKKSHSDLAGRWQGPEWEDQTCAAVLEVADLLDKKLVVMVENMQDICKQADRHFGWKLRKVMQTEPSVVLIASATSRFEALDARGPFFDIFRTVNLGPMSAVQCARLWKAIADESVDERGIQPLRILTGGSPRLIAAVAGSRRSLADPMENLADLVDERTEYFRSQFRALTGHKRRVYTALVDLWQPSSASEVARRSRLDIRAVSTMLGRLVRDGLVETVDNGTRGRYAVVERLTCICYKMRRQRDGVAVVRRLVDFMRAYYGRDRAEALRSGIAATAGLGNEAAAIDQISAMYDAVPPGRLDVLQVMLGHLMSIITVAAVRADEDAQQGIVKVLSSEDAKAAMLQPLIVALRIRLGEPVRAPAEVLDIASDIVEELERREHLLRAEDATRG